MTVEVYQFQLYQRVVKVAMHKKCRRCRFIGQVVQMTLEVDQPQNYDCVVKVIIRKRDKGAVLLKRFRMTVEVKQFQHKSAWPG